MITDAIELYILILVHVTWILIQGHRSARTQTFLLQLSDKVSVSFNGLWYTVETCWLDQLHFILFKGENPTYVISWKKTNTSDVGLLSNIYLPISFKLGYILISVLMTLTFIVGHSCMRNQELWCPFSLKKIAVNLEATQYVATSCCSVVTWATFSLHK